MLSIYSLNPLLTPRRSLLATIFLCNGILSAQAASGRGPVPKEFNDIVSEVEVGTVGKSIEDIDRDAWQTEMINWFVRASGDATDDESVARWYQRLAERADIGTQNSLADTGKCNLGVEEDDQGIFVKYLRATTQGILEAQFRLGRMYLEGLAVDANSAAAARWIIRSAENGNRVAYHDAATLYWEGAGVVRNPVEAYKWWLLSSMHGNEASDARLTAAKAKMRRSQIEAAAAAFVGTYIPKHKRTNAGLYITAAAAFAKLSQEPERFTIVDVRTPEEYFYIGHPPMARNIPVGFFTGTLSPDGKEPEMRSNNGFLAEVTSSFKFSDHILLICRSGVRSALAAVGFLHVYNIVDGFEGDRKNAPGSSDNGKRVVNGWRNSDAPWTYEADPDLVYKNDF